MTATNNVNGGGAERGYMRGCGVEVWYGTRRQIQALGFGVNAEFPDRVGLKHALHAEDDRGNPVKIELLWRYDSGAEYYSAVRQFRDWDEARRERRRQLTSDFAPGVTCFKGGFWADEYTGDRDSLVAACLVRHEDLPGQPGRGKTRVSFNRDGSLAVRGGERAEVRWRKVIHLVGKNRFRVEIPIDDAEHEARRAEYALFDAGQRQLDNEALEARTALSAPARRTSHLRLAWSRP
jgi:hypothetical protein